MDMQSNLLTLIDSKKLKEKSLKDIVYETFRKIRQYVEWESDKQFIAYLLHLLRLDTGVSQNLFEVKLKNFIANIAKKLIDYTSVEEASNKIFSELRKEAF